MKNVRMLVPMVGALVALAACSGETAGNPGPENAGTQQSVAASDAPREGRHGPGRFQHGPPGPQMLVFAALHEDIGLSPEQKTKIEALKDSMRPTPPPPPSDATRPTALAAAIRSGTIDATTLQPAREKLKAAHEEQTVKLASSLTTLHDTLTKEQRAKLVDAVRSKAKGRGEQHAERGPRGPRGENAGKFQGKFAGKHAGPDARRGGPMMHLLEGLDLTDAQRKEIESKLEANRPARPSEGDREAMKAKFEQFRKDLDARLESFKADAFDAKAFVAPPAGFDAEKGFGPNGGMADRMATELQAVVSVLDAAQREKLAQKIEQGPPAGAKFRQGGPRMAPAGR